MNLQDILTSIGSFIGAVGGLFMIWSVLKKAKTDDVTASGDYTNDMSTSVAIVYKQAKEALQDKAIAEIQHKKEIAELKAELLEVKMQLLSVQTQMKSIEDALAYEIKLIAYLGDNPKIEHVNIKRIPMEKGK
jgi:hypothetical protein